MDKLSWEAIIEIILTMLNVTAQVKYLNYMTTILTCMCVGERSLVSTRSYKQAAGKTCVFSDCSFILRCVID